METEQNNSSRVGLVLEGGGVRGIYTAGVLDAFMEENLHFDGVIGVSAGAIHGCSYLSNQKGRSLRYYRKYCQDPRFMSFRSWIRTGDFVGVDFCYHELPEKLDRYDYDLFSRCGVPFYVGCSNVETGQAEYIQITDMKEQIDYLRASASLPYFSRIVNIDGKKYLDGGCTDSIPVEAFRKMGYRRCVVVLTRDIGYRKSSESKWMTRLLYRKYPAFVNALCQRHTVYNRTVEKILELEKEGAIFVIRPEHPLNIGRLDNDPENIQRVYDVGYADAKRYRKDLQAWMKSDAE